MVGKAGFSLAQGPPANDVGDYGVIPAAYLQSGPLRWEAVVESAPGVFAGGGLSPAFTVRSRYSDRWIVAFRLRCRAAGR